MNLLTRIAFRLLRSSGWTIRELSDSWGDALISSGDRDADTFSRMLNRAVQDVALRKVIEAHQIDLVVDVGANRGQFARKIRGLGFAGPILSIEPNPHVFSLLAAESCVDQQWSVKNAAISEMSGPMNLHTTVDDSFSSSRKPNRFSSQVFGNLSAVTGTVQVEALSLAQLLGEFEAERNQSFKSILLKTDTQGMDQDVIRSAGPFLNVVQCLMVEMPLKAIYEELTGFEQLFAEYRGYGFELVFNAPVSWGRNGEIVELDCLFARPCDTG